MSNKETIELRMSDGATPICTTEIHCAGALPVLIVWDDSPDGKRSFVYMGGVSYREQPAYLLSIGEVIPRRTTALKGSAGE